MAPISSIGAPRQTAAAGGVKEAAPLRELPREEAARKPQRDTYVPEEKQEPSGRYWIEHDQDGTPKVRFDGPAGEPEAPEQEDPENAPAPGSPERKGAERCTADTDDVDREIERLKERRETLEQQLRQEQNPARARELERQLAQAERELRQKDNDGYRRQHTRFTGL